MSAIKKSHGQKRTLSADERQLWRKVTRTLAPLRKDTKGSVAEEPEITSGAQAVSPTPVETKVAVAKKIVPNKKPQLQELDRKTRHKLSRGGNSIDATIDLHGMRQSEAHTALRQFLAAAQHRGDRFVIVITGKGDRDQIAAGSQRQRGVLRTSVPHWLQTGEFQSFVVGYSEASRQHGGAGAIYIQIRRLRRPLPSSGSNAGPAR